MFNKKKIKELEEEIDYLKKSVVRDETSGYLILQNDAVGIKLHKEVTAWSWGWSSYTKEVVSTIYFKKGTEPKCDYIKQDIDGKRTYYKNDVEVKIK